jgi:hypothetical protein
MDISEETLLKHYGVKGMHWGIRNDKESSDPRFSKKQKVIAGAAVTAAVGAALAGAYLKKNSNIRAADLRKRTSQFEASRRVWDAHRGVKLNEINRGFNNGTINSDQGWRLSALLDRNRDTRLRSVAANLNLNPSDLGLDSRIVAGPHSPVRLPSNAARLTSNAARLASTHPTHTVFRALNDR